MISGVLAIAISIPICIGAFKSQYVESHTAEPTQFETVSVENETVFDDIETVFDEIETTTPVQDETEVVTEPTINRTALGEFKITAYCACTKCCSIYADGITYTGTIATEGRTIAVDPDVIPLGSIVEVNGHEYIAEDIGGAIKGNRLDIFFNSHQDALEWGVQYLDVFLIEFTQFR